MTEIITRKQAKEQGLIRYFSGNPCIHGHVSERWTLSRACIACRIPYLREYRMGRLVNPKYTQEYRDKNRQKLRDYNREYMREYRKRRAAEGKPLP